MLTPEKLKELQIFATQIRIQTVHQLVKRGFGHLGGSMSMAEALSTLYGAVMKVDPKNPQWEERDWLVCSKGHAGPAIYSALALKGYFPMDWLDTLNQPGTNLPSHCDRQKTPGIDMTTGSLGQGISVAAGLAKAFQLDGMPNRVFCFVGDGECQEGQVWEAVLFAAQHKLDNFYLLVDNNHVQLDGATSDLNNLEDFKEKFDAFHWDSYNVNGHDIAALYDTIQQASQMRGKPHAIIMDTVKGQGYRFLLNVYNHHVSISEDEAAAVIDDLNAELQRLNA